MAAHKQLRWALGLAITLITVGLFWYYLAHHASVLHQLATTSPATILTLLGLYALWFGTIALILQACLRLCSKEIPHGENLTLNAYSTFLNYFLPGQGGMALRGLYLKGRHDLPLRRYIFVTLIYYIMYAAVSALLLIGGARSWWQTLIAVLVVSSGAYLGTKFYARKRQLGSKGLNLSFENLAYLLVATCLQAVLQVAIYWVELSHIVPGLRIGQVMSYTGAANFALFVSITPGAVGIRESFLIFSEKLHHITNAAIVGANVLDRSVYIVFLALIFLGLLAVRGRSILTFKSEAKLAAELAEATEAAPATRPALSKTS